MQVERPNGAVQGGADDDEAAGGEGDAGDAAGVLGEGDKAEPAVGVPHFHLKEQNTGSALEKNVPATSLPAGVLDSLSHHPLLSPRTARLESKPERPCC